jgi:hypothetical protein
MVSESSEAKTNNPLFEKAVHDYLESCDSVILSTHRKKLGIPEFEIRFGTNTKQSNPISKIDYDNVVRELWLNEWKTDNIEGIQMLRITPEYYDSKIGEQKYLNDTSTDELHSTNELYGGERNRGNGSNTYSMSNIRAEIIGADMIELYCKTNSMDVLKDTPSSHHKLKFTKKTLSPRKIGPFINGKNTPFIDYYDFNFRVAFQYETSFPINSEYDVIRKMMNDWNSSKKNFRCMNRVRFYHPDSVVCVDISIIKNNRTYTTPDKKKIPIPTQTIQESGLFQNPEHYEIELELDNDKIQKMVDHIKNNGNETMDNLVETVMFQIRKSIRMILSGIQGTPYPISYSEQQNILYEYMKRIHGNEWAIGKKNEETNRFYPYPYFLGPSSKTLQMKHILNDSDSASSEPNIVYQYTVTEKADGDRMLLYISKTGKIYMINTNLKILFTGAITREKHCFDSLLDGEYIAYGKHSTNRVFLHLFAAFDIYYIGSRKHPSVRELGFTKNKWEDGEDETHYRLNLLQKFIEILNPVSITSSSSNDICRFHIKCKTFHNGPEIDDRNNPDILSIFEKSKQIWDLRDQFEYEIDGLIFTPMNTGVGSDSIGSASELKKMTWERSFKWKPPQYNTIDFLVSVKKDKSGKDEIHNKIITDDKNEMSTIMSYKTLILRCGFNEKKHKYVNAIRDMLQDRISKKIQETQTDDETGTGFISGIEYQPVPFIPSSPYDEEACFCNVILEKNLTDPSSHFMRTKENDIFQEDMIVEFSYDTENKSLESAWKWVPLRVRYDKTNELRANKNNFGNDFTVANDNWHSIHFPITENIITGQDIPNKYALDDTIYYNRKEKDSRETQPLRDFHNLFIKRKIIDNLAKYIREKMHISSILLMDYAVGKAGDLSKWKDGKIDFVFGLDISKDNITNRNDGACIRYLDFRNKDPRNKLRAIFLHANSGKNIRIHGKSYYNVQDKEISNSVFGNGKPSTILNSKFHGIARDGFHISSCQFAMHYFFQNNITLHSFLRNLTECTRVGGYFIGTCYNGQRVFDLLERKKRGESIVLEKNGKKIFEITKNYSNQLNYFPENEESIGISIYVYQESIDKTFEEFLVNFTYFTRLMEDYGFVVLSKSEYSSIGYPESSGSFESMYRQMMQEIRQNSKISDYRNASHMSKEEMTISFLNQYFIYKKVRNITPEMLRLLHKKYVSEQTEVETEGNYENEIVNDHYDEMIKTNENIKYPKKTNIRKLSGKKIILKEEIYSPISINEIKSESIKPFGEYQHYYDRLPKETKTKFDLYPKEKQMEILKKIKPKIKLQ